MGKVTAKPEPYQDAESKHDKKKNAVRHAEWFI